MQNILLVIRIFNVKNNKILNSGKNCKDLFELNKKRTFKQKIL